MKNTIIVLIALFISISSFAQGLGMNYKAVIKDGSGNVVASQVVKVRFSILDSDSNIDYQETHEPTTDANGIIVLSIGWGDNVIGSFWDIDWGNDFYYLKTDIDTLPFDDYVEFAAVIFNSVPYAYRAVNAYSAEIAENVTTKLDQLDDAKSDGNGSSVFLGVGSGLADDGTNNRNVGVGFQTLQANTFGYNNVATGHLALKANTSGHSNVANGANALLSNTTGIQNTTNGANSLVDNTIGSSNTANGYEAMRFNTEGSNNIAIGKSALQKNTEGSFNSAVGLETLSKNLIGNFNTAMGNRALLNNTASENTAIGNIAMYSNISGSNNTAIGSSALYDNTNGNLNTAIGYQALDGNTTGNNNTAIGYGAQVPNGAANNQIRIGNTAIQSATTQVAWTFPSDIRWKENVRALPYGLDMLKQLQPVDYVRKNNDAKTRDMGFIAQDVEALLAKIGYTDQGFLTKDDKGYLSIRYNDFIALLTKAVQEQQDIITEQNTQIKELSTDNSFLKNTVNDLIERVEKIEANNQ